jgi:hypothetical protein
MTADLLEERLRSALHDATAAEDGAYLDLDPDLVLVRGRRAVLRRRMAAGASVAAATAVVGLAGWAALGGGAERASVPGGSPSAAVRATGTATANLTDVAVIPQEGGAPEQGQDVRITVDRATGVVRYSTLRDGTARPVAEGRLPTSPRAATWSPLSSMGLVVGIMPEAATDQVFVWAGDAPGSSFDAAALPGTGFKAFAVWHTGAVGETTFAGLDWTDGDAVYRSDGSRVTSRVDGDLVAFVDEKQGLFGMFGDGSSATKRLQDTAAGERPVMMMGNQRDGADTLVNAVLVILPAGATDVTPVASPGATVTAWSSLVDQSIDPTLVVVRIDVPLKVAGTGLGSISWTETDGRTSTFEPRL